jgi:hypothetical protein
VQHRHARRARAHAGGLGLDEIVTEVVRRFFAVVFDEMLGTGGGESSHGKVKGKK